MRVKSLKTELFSKSYEARLFLYGFGYRRCTAVVKLYNRPQNGENVHMITQWLKSVHRELNFEDSEYEHIVVKLGSSFVYSSC